MREERLSERRDRNEAREGGTQRSAGEKCLVGPILSIHPSNHASLPLPPVAMSEARVLQLPVSAEMDKKHPLG